MRAVVGSVDGGEARPDFPLDMHRLRHNPGELTRCVPLWGALMDVRLTTHAGEVSWPGNASCDHRGEE
jgi:hypothetical protein